MDNAIEEAIDVLIRRYPKEFDKLVKQFDREIRVHGGILR